MYKITLPLLVLGFSLIACSPSKRSLGPYSLKTALVLQGYTIGEKGINFYERRYIEANFPGSKIIQETMIVRNDKTYNVFTVYPKHKRRTVKVYFDITELL